MPSAHGGFFLLTFENQNRNIVYRKSGTGLLDTHPKIG
jgi:hypothetical protein